MHAMRPNNGRVYLIGWLGLIQSELDRLDSIRLSWQKERLNQFRSVYLDVASINVKVNRAKLVAELRQNRLPCLKILNISLVTIQQWLLSATISANIIKYDQKHCIHILVNTVLHCRDKNYVGSALPG